MAVHESTLRVLQACQARYQSLRDMARQLGLPAGVLSDILNQHGYVSWRQENRVRRALHLPPLRAPLVLLPDERLIHLRPAEKRDKRRCYHVSVELKARLDRQRRILGLSQEDYLTWLADLANLADERLTRETS